MLPLYSDPWFTFRFADDRRIDRIHLEGVAPGTAVIVYRIDPESGERGAVLAREFARADGWVDFALPLIVRSGEAFIAVPETS
jgi:hypothetical protein